MNRRMRLAIVLVAIALTGLVVVSAVIVYTADDSRIKALIQTTVSDVTGRELTIAGDLSLTISLNPQLVMEDVTLANASWGSKPGMLKIGKLKVGAKLFPLFVGDLEIDDIQFTDTVVLTETDANDQGNWHFTTPRSSHEGISIKRLGVSQLNLQRFAVTYRNGQTQSTEHYTLDNLELNRLPGTDLLSVALTGNLNEQAATLSGQIGSSFMGAKYPLNLSGEVAGLAFKLEGEIGNLLQAEDLDLAVQASATNLTTLGTRIGVVIPKTDSFSMSAQLTGNGEAVTMNKADATIKHSGAVLGITGGIGNLNTLEHINFELTSSANNLSDLQAIAGSTKLPDAGPFTASARLSGSARALAVRDALTVIKQKGSQLQVSGKIANLQQLSGIDLSFNGSAEDFTELGSTFGTQLPDLGAFKISGQLLGSSDVLDLKNVSAVIDQSDFSATGQVKFGRRPSVSMRLESALIDFTRLMGETEKLSQQETGKEQDPEALIFSKQPIPFDLLDAVDADIKLNAKHLKIRDAALDLGKLALRQDAGELRIDTLEAAYKKTRISASLNIKTGSPAQVVTKVLVQDFDLGSFLKETQKIGEVEGQADFAMDLRSQGDSPHSLMAALDGTVGAVIGKGRVPHILDFLAQDLTSQVLPFWGNHKPAGELDCGVIEFSITQGIATSKTFLLDTHLGHYKAKGHTNFDTEKINFLLIPKPKKLTLVSLSTKLSCDRQY